ncbi:hypothetical protein HNP24_004232 [Chryseobacterium sediminis]|uniref:Bacteriocin n=1 Tax=Chryseobacterium sediminis TaxID=1679494 RepID=A0ABR6Q5G0_9FLAO|nr:hypothetical protein [Chryseobacterium sediminis]MBB6333208.1 hypothetical protein [Chryseobacterium sediminis]
MKKTNLSKSRLTRNELKNINGSLAAIGIGEGLDPGGDIGGGCPSTRPIYRCFKLQDGSWYCYCGYN